MRQVFLVCISLSLYISTIYSNFMKSWTKCIPKDGIHDMRDAHQLVDAIWSLWSEHVCTPNLQIKNKKSHVYILLYSTWFFFNIECMSIPLSNFYLLLTIAYYPNLQTLTLLSLNLLKFLWIFLSTLCVS